MGALNLSRRKFLIATGVVGGGLVVGIALTGSGDPPPMQSDKGVFSPNAFLQLTEDGLNQPKETALRNELMAISVHSQSQDWAEGLAAFAEKRKPNFTGR